MSEVQKLVRDVRPGSGGVARRMRVPDEVGEELKVSFSREKLAEANLSVIDSAAHACICRVLSRRGLGQYVYAFVWPVITVEVRTGTPDERKFVFDIRELG